MAVPREIKVGAFVLAGLIVVGLVIFLIGEERQLFSSKVEYKTSFEDVEGLRRGSPVRMGGVDVGTVSRVAYSEDAKDTTIYVLLSITEGESMRIRKDSRATIESKGLLGDKMVVITVGKPTQPRLEPGGVIPSERGADPPP
jgi:phospholipid/cholesterol/gamma-HCH transport system substrate-binding protein